MIRNKFCSWVLPLEHESMVHCRDDGISPWKGIMPSSRRDAFQVEFSTAEILGMPALFTRCRVDTDTLPNGLFSYEVRGNEDCFTAIEIAPYITANFIGTILVCERLVSDKTQRRILFPGDVDMSGRSEYLADWWCVYGF